MAQQEILNILEAHPDKWFSTKEFHDITGISISRVIKAASQLRKYNEVLYKTISTHGGGYKAMKYLYSWKDPHGIDMSNNL